MPAIGLFIGIASVNGGGGTFAFTYNGQRYTFGVTAYEYKE